MIIAKNQDLEVFQKQFISNFLVLSSVQGENYFQTCQDEIPLTAFVNTYEGPLKHL